ncbi:MAG TPA: LytTR family transcriptional regulator DNA-binding domain-containing protein [Marmoricola sp.]
MNSVQRVESAPPRSGEASIYRAWERFVRGEDDVCGVRPEVVISWHRCRDQYHVDPYLTAAPVAVAEVRHPVEHDAVFAELGFRAAAMAHEVASIGGIVTVTDGAGRILAEWGDKDTCSIAASAGLAPWFCWSESAVGTNGMGTALGTQNPVVITRAEHWCRAFHDWTCAGVAVRSVVSKEPIAVLNVACWRGDLPRTSAGWLANAATHTQTRLRMRARDSGAELLAAYRQARARSTAPLAAVDTAGKVVIADETASVLLGVPGNTPALDPAVRWLPRLPAFIGAARYATKQASANPDWTGSTEVVTHLADEPAPIGIRPMFLYGDLVGHLIAFGSTGGEQLKQAEARPRARGQPRRMVGVRENRTVLLRLPEVSFAESQGNEVWLSTDRGRLRAAAPGLDRLDSELADAGFLRVHRHYVVNLNRIREVERRDRGELFLVMDDDQNTMVPVSRRNARTVRGALGI